MVLGMVAVLDEARCDGCRECLRLCKARALIWASADRMVLLDPWACTGCGSCVSACSRKALSLAIRDET